MKLVIFCCLLFATFIWVNSTPFVPMEDAEITAIKKQCRNAYNLTSEKLKTMKFDDPEDFLALNYTYCQVVKFGYFNAQKGLDCRRIAMQIQYKPTTAKQVFDQIKRCCADKNPRHVPVQLWAARTYNCVVSTKIYKKVHRDKNAYATLERREKEIHNYVLLLRRQEEEREARRNGKKKSIVAPITIH